MENTDQHEEITSVLEVSTMDDQQNPETGIVESRPDHIPEKFWNSETGTLRSEVLLKSYGELEKRFAGEVPLSPKSAEDYDISIDTDMFETDPELNERLHGAGFNNEQAQLVYDLALEHLLPIAEQLTQTMDKKAQIERLETHFGGRKGWVDTERQLQNWGRSNLSVEAFETMSGSFDGVLAMHRMMAKNEPSILGAGQSPSSLRSESDLKIMMKDPRYWRDQNPAYVEQIRQGFEALYST